MHGTLGENHHCLSHCWVITHTVITLIFWIPTLPWKCDHNPQKHE